MRPATRIDQDRFLEEAVRFIAGRLDGPVHLGELADHVGFSRFHFHRIFQARLGESVGEMSRRLRLERACLRLCETEVPITELAFEAGYSAHEAFIRAFRSAYRCTPSAMRNFPLADPKLPAENGIHFGSSTFPLHLLAPQGHSIMQIQVKELPPQKAVVMAHRGPYPEIGATFGKFGPWMYANQLQGSLCVALFYDDPEATPKEELRSDAGAFVPETFTTTDPEVQVKDVEGGAYATTLFVGPYRELPAAWGEFMSQSLPAGYGYRPAPPFEVYVKMSDEPGGPESETELYMAVEKLDE